jgi:hypothetical protein
MMRRLIYFGTGFGLGFGFAAAAIAAFVLFGLGVGGHFLVVNDRNAARVISYDPSTVAARAPYPAAVAVLFFIIFVSLVIRIGRAGRER